MNTVSAPDHPPGRCPRCDAVIPPEAPGGLCPRCVLLGAATPSESGGALRPGEPPPLDAVRAAFPQLEISGLIGRGGMGFVYRARQPQLDRPVALKLLPVPAGADPTFAERFAREGRLLARLNHPNIVAVYEFGQAAGFAFLLLEFVDGVNLRQAMQAGRFSAREALAIVPKICEALQFAHEHGVLHRDIKPENILLDAAGRVKIADFGIAKLVGDRPGDVTLTASGARLGTPHYMAPEQVEKPSEVDHRADIYSLGVVFYELLTGELPLGRFAAPSAKADLDSRVDAIVLRALAKERELRQQSAGQVKTEVEGLGMPEIASAPASRPNPSDRTTRLTGWVVLGSAVPAVAMGLFAATLVLSDSSWHPGPEELRVTLGIWLAAFVTPLAGVRLLRLGQRGAGEIRRGAVGAALATGLLLGLTCLGGLYSLSPHFAGLLFVLLPALAAMVLLLRATWNRSGREFPQASGGPRTSPWPQRFGWLSLALGCLCLLIFSIYGLATPLTYLATLRFKADEPSAVQIEADFASRIAAQNPSVKLTRIRDTALFEIRGSGYTPEAAVGLANDAYDTFKAGPWGKDFELIDRAEMPQRASGPNRSAALVLGLLGFMGLGVPGLWLITRPGRDAPPPAGYAAPNPWPHRLFWLLVGMFTLPASALVAGLIAPRFRSAPIAAGLLVAFVGAGLWLGFWKTRPTAAQAKPCEPWNPWPKRIFLVVVGFVVLPVGLLILGLVLPWTMRVKGAPPPPLVSSHSFGLRLERPMSTPWELEVRFWSNGLAVPLPDMSGSLDNAADGAPWAASWELEADGTLRMWSNSRFGTSTPLGLPPVVKLRPGPHRMETLLPLQATNLWLFLPDGMPDLAGRTNADWGLEAVIRPSNAAAPPPGIVSQQMVQLIRTERMATDSEVRLRWELRSPVPASVRLSFGRQDTELSLYQRGVGDFRETVTVRFERQKDGGAAVQLMVMAGDVTLGRGFGAALGGDPRELLAKANELVAGDLALKFNTPVWVAFFADTQVVLEVIAKTNSPLPAAKRATNAAGSPVTPWATTTGWLSTSMLATNPAVSPAAATVLELELAENWLREILKRADLGLVAPQGEEVLNAKLAVDVAKANLRGGGLAAAEAKLRHSESKLMIQSMKHQVGQITDAELNEAILAVDTARIPVIKLDRQPPEGEFRAVLQYLPPSLGHATSFRVTAWTNGVARPLPELDFTLPATPRPFSLEWHLKPVGTDGEFDLWVTSMINEDVGLIPQVKVRVNLGAFNRMRPFSMNPNPTFIDHPVRCWTFLPRWVAGKPETDVQTTYGWGVSVDVGPPDAFTPSPPSGK